MSRTPSPRPFRLSDALVLIVATAVGLALIKFVDDFNGGLFKGVKREELFGGIGQDRAFAWLKLVMKGWMVVYFMEIPWTVALLGLRLKQPRPRLSRIWRQPGTVACLGSVLLFMHQGVLLGGQAVVGRGSGIPWKKIAFSLNVPGSTGEIILGLWTLLCLGRLVRSERSWIDRTGRAIGASMVLLYLTASLVPAWINAMSPKFDPSSLSVPPWPDLPGYVPYSPNMPLILHDESAQPNLPLKIVPTPPLPVPLPPGEVPANPATVPRRD